MTRLFIENKELDLTADLSQQITYAIDDIRNIDSKATSFSRTIILPGTANNNNLFGQIFEFNHANFVDDNAANVEYNFNAAKAASCRLISDSVQIMKGILRMLEIINDKGRIEYEVCIFGELGGLMSAMGTNRLEDLDFSEYDHSYIAANITASWVNWNAGEGYVYPLIDYGNYGYNNKNDWNIRTLRPALFVREYIDKIFSEAGYTWNSAFFDTNFFKRLIIPNNTKELVKYTNYALDLSTASHSYTNADGAEKAVNYPIQTALGGFTASAGDTTFTYSGNTFTGTVQMRIKGNYRYTGGIPFFVDIRRNGVTVRRYSVYAGASPTPTTDVFFDFLIDPFDITINNNDVIRVFVTHATTGTWTFYLSTGQHFFKIQSSGLVASPVTQGSTIPINDTIPRGILQKDFLTSIMKMFNLYVYENNMKNKHVEIKPYPDFYIDSTDDYSDRVDRSQPMRLKPMSELNARYYQYKYKQDNDFYNETYRKKYNEGYGDRTFDTKYDFAQETQSLEVIFAGTPIVGYAGQPKIYSTILKQSNTQNSISEDRTDSIIRILQCKLFEDVGSWNICDEGSNQSSQTNLIAVSDYVYAGHLDDPYNPDVDINFGAPKELFYTLSQGRLSANLFNVYYSPYMAEITDKDSRLLTCYIKFNQLQIHNLDFSRYIWIDGGLYRLMRIIDYTPGTTDVCKVELLRVINKTY